MRGGNRIKRRSGFVHQKNLWLYCQCAGNAKALLLTAGKPQSILFQSVLNFLPDSRVPERTLHNIVQLHFTPYSVRSGAIGDIVVNTHGKGIRFLKHHANILPKRIYIYRTVVDIFSVIHHITGNPYTRDQVIHSV